MRHAVPPPEPTPSQQVRLDVWLDVACLFKTRSDAQKACTAGRVEVNGQASKPHRLLRVGDEIRLARGHGRRQIVAVRALAERHLPKAEARELYEDRTPPPTPQELEMIDVERAFRRTFGAQPPRAPDKRERRALRRLKGRQDDSGR
jgi:ribosome-associated heat shock protein Hsp15